MYSIIETYNNVETIIGNVKTNDDFIGFVKNGLHTEIYEFKTDIKIENILTDLSLAYGKYLIHNENIMTYLEKIKGVNAGYLYNSEKPELKISYNWRLIKNETLIDKLYTIEEPVSIIDKTSETIINEDFDSNNIQKLNVYDIKYNDKISIIGMSNSGKSWIIRNILKNFNANFISNSLIISPTEDTKSFYINDFNSRISNIFNAELINEYIESKNSCAIILDDCLNSQSFEQNKELLNKLLNSNKLVIITYQFPFLGLMDFKFNYHILLRYSFYNNQNKLYKIINTDSLSMSTFSECFNKLTSDEYGCMVVHNDETKISNKIKYFKAI